MRTFVAVLLACGSAAGTADALGGEQVALQGMLGNKALLIVNGSPPKTVAPGETFRGVKVLSTSGQEAVVEVEGKRLTLRVGEAPASVGASGGDWARGSRVVLAAGTGGHFTTPGTINGRPVQFLVDTGASAVSMSQSQADRIGIDYEHARRVRMDTANGAVAGWVVKLASVRIGDVEVYDVDAIIAPASMPFVLLGNSYLGRFKVQLTNNQMVLERRY
ncbi:MAG TPA: retropepsin-like aspartic protease [Ramlibacter sp.]|uniref:retropepsin-like aspartic protease family protein n=1 Tax=Ramlibacter sp. TaxID=1917967 RepID=UPI002C560301|nr:retropepsin-like aspartic protease [Ramlibacter sp.]HVZ46072.1 retropepsin-like aspartic protease [Ramlibacter sp.]